MPKNSPGVQAVLDDRLVVRVSTWWTGKSWRTYCSVNRYSSRASNRQRETDVNMIQVSRPYQRFLLYLACLPLSGGRHTWSQSSRTPIRKHSPTLYPQTRSLGVLSQRWCSSPLRVSAPKELGGYPRLATQGRRTSAREGFRYTSCCVARIDRGP